MIRAVLATGGKPPLEAPGLEIHDKLARLDDTVAGVLKRHDTRLAGQLARHLHRAVTRTHDHAEQVRRLNRFVRRAARVLGQKGKTSQEVRADFDLLLDRIRTRLGQPSTSPEEAEALGKMVASADYYGEKLFTCCDHKDMPPTDNGHEHTFGRLRGYERRVTGHKSTSRTVRDGAQLAPVIERVLRRGAAKPEELARVSPEVYKERLDEMNEARGRHRRPRLIRGNYNTVLEELASYGDGRRARRGKSNPLDRAILRC